MEAGKPKKTGGALCVFCAALIDEGQDYRSVVGWERISRSKGGTNALRDRKPLDTTACRWCVEKLAKGIAPGQRSMFGY